MSKQAKTAKSPFDATSPPGYKCGMALGKGVYDMECSHVRKLTGARAVVLMVANGERGSGMSVQAEPGFDAMLPAMLRTLAELIERENAAIGKVAQGN